MPTTERREHRRLPLRLPLAYRRVGVGKAYTGRAVTANISTTGLYFEVDDPALEEGTALGLCLTVPPAAGVSPFDTELRTTGEIVRLVRPLSGRGGDSAAGGRSGVAVRFSRPLEYDFRE